MPSRTSDKIPASIQIASRVLLGRPELVQHVTDVILADASANGIEAGLGLGKPTWNLIVTLRLAEVARDAGKVRQKALGALHHLNSRRHNSLLPLGVFGPGLAIVHLGGLVVNPRASVGTGCRIHQFVTIGSNRGGVPTVGDDVWIGPGAVIAGDITIGDGAVIGANCVVGADVPPGAVLRAPRPETVSSAGSASLMPSQAEGAW